jgi:hypothetical protein
LDFTSSDDLAILLMAPFGRSLLLLHLQLNKVSFGFPDDDDDDDDDDTKNLFRPSLS